MNPVLLIGGAAVLLLASGKKKSKSVKSTKPCPPLQPGSGHIAGFDYVETATGGADLRERLPIIFFFHGLGSQPTGFFKYFYGMSEKARVILPYGHEKYGSNPAWWTLRSKTEDQAGLAQQMGAQGQAVAEFVTEANRCLGGVGKPIITGHSQGGMMTYAVAAAAPHAVRAAVPVAGWLPVSMWPSKLPPTYAIHGTSDRTVNYARTEDFISRATAAGLPIEWHPIDGQGHGFSGGSKDAWFNIIRMLLEASAE